jgi:hypothetical protein
VVVGGGGASAVKIGFRAASSRSVVTFAGYS